MEKVGNIYIYVKNWKKKAFFEVSYNGDRYKLYFNLFNKKFLYSQDIKELELQLSSYFKLHDSFKIIKSDIDISNFTSKIKRDKDSNMWQFNSKSYKVSY